MPVEKQSNRNDVKIAFFTTNNTKRFSFIFPPLIEREREREKAHTRRGRIRRITKEKEREKF